MIYFNYYQNNNLLILTIYLHSNCPEKIYSYFRDYDDQNLKCSNSGVPCGKIQEPNIFICHVVSHFAKKFQTMSHVIVFCNYQHI